MKKLLIVTMALTLFITGCSQNKSVTSGAAEQPVTVKINEAPKNEATSEEIMNRVETSALAESVPIPANFPISYVPIIDGAQIIQGESKTEAGQTVFNVTQSVNLVPEDAYRYYSDLYTDAPSYILSNEKEGETMSVERSKNGLSATLQFIAAEEGKSQIIMQVVVLD